MGLSEEAAKASEIPYKTGTFSFLANGRARCMDETDGMVKVMAEAKTDRILGVHIMTPSCPLIFTIWSARKPAISRF